MSTGQTNFRCCVAFCLALLAFEVSGQKDYAFELDTLLIFEVSDLNLGLGDLSRLGAGSNELLWPIRNKQKANFILAFDCRAHSFHEIEVSQNACLDKSYTLRGVTGKDALYFVWSNSGLIFDSVKHTCECVDVPDITSGLFTQNGYLTFSNYFRDDSQAPYVNLFSQSTNARFEISPDHFELTRFNPNTLIATTNRHIARVSVSKPIVYIYNNAFQRIDSVVYDTINWVEMETHFDEKELSKLKKEKDDFFGFYFELFDRGLSKNTNLQFINDSTLIVGYIAGTGNHYFSVISLDGFGKIEQITSPRKVGQGLCFQEGVDRLNPAKYEPVELAARGVAVDGSLYYVNFGTETFPWGESCEVLGELQNRPNPNRLKWLHIFKYKLVEK